MNSAAPTVTRFAAPSFISARVTFADGREYEKTVAAVRKRPRWENGTGRKVTDANLIAELEALIA